MKVRGFFSGRFGRLGRSHPDPVAAAERYLVNEFPDQVLALEAPSGIPHFVQRVLFEGRAAVGEAAWHAARVIEGHTRAAANALPVAHDQVRERAVAAELHEDAQKALVEGQQLLTPMRRFNSRTPKALVTALLLVGDVAGMTLALTYAGEIPVVAAVMALAVGAGAVMIGKAGEVVRVEGTRRSLEGGRLDPESRRVVELLTGAGPAAWRLHRRVVVAALATGCLAPVAILVYRSAEQSVAVGFAFGLWAMVIGAGSFANAWYYHDPATIVLHNLEDQVAEAEEARRASPMDAVEAYNDHLAAAAAAIVAARSAGQMAWNRSLAAAKAAQAANPKVSGHLDTEASLWLAQVEIPVMDLPGLDGLPPYFGTKAPARPATEASPGAPSSPGGSREGANGMSSANKAAARGRQAPSPPAANGGRPPIPMTDSRSQEPNMSTTTLTDRPGLRPCGHQARVTYIILDGSASVLGDGSAPAPTSWHPWVREAVRRYATGCPDCLADEHGAGRVAIVHFRPGGPLDRPPTPLTVRGLHDVLGAIDVPPDSAGSALSYAIDAVERAAAHHGELPASFIVVSDFDLTDSDPWAVLDRLGGLPGKVHAVVLGGRTPRPLQRDRRVTVTRGAPRIAAVAGLRRGPRCALWRLGAGVSRRRRQRNRRRALALALAVPATVTVGLAVRGEVPLQGSAGEPQAYADGIGALHVVPADGVPLWWVEVSVTTSVEGAATWTLPSALLFDVGSAELGPDAAAAVADIAGRAPGGRVHVDCHASADGDEHDNQVLSDRRAEGLAAAIEEAAGLPPASVGRNGWGESRPLPGVDPATPTGEARNRRCEVTIEPHG